MVKPYCMRHLVSERKLLLAAVLISIGLLLFSQVTLISDPVLVSEKGLALLLLSIVLLTIGVVQVVKTVTRI